MFQFTRREQLGTLILAGLLLAGLATRFLLVPKPPEIVVQTAPQEENREKPAEMMVHVAGAVLRPGVYTLPAGARVHDAITAAGGALPEGDPHALNLAEPLFDGRRITVPLVAESGEKSNEDGRINVNTATVSELERLPGIGPAKAAAIFSYREKNGPFRTVEDLAGVPGIGLKTVESLKESITLY